MGHIKLNFRGRSRSKCEIVLSVIICLISIGSARATDYYFSNGGSDSNSGNSPGSAWATVSKMQQTINTLGPGDRILLERGSVWYEVTLNFSSRNGTAANPICFEAYGEGDRPKLSGGKVHFPGAISLFLPEY